MEMALCEHLVPIKFGCHRCEMNKIYNNITDIKIRLETLEQAMPDAMTRLVEDAHLAQDLFDSKIHSLVNVDKMRNDVINSLCQKIEMIDQKLRCLYGIKLEKIQCQSQEITETQNLSEMLRTDV